MRERIKKAAPFVIGLVLFVAALEVLRIELSAFTWRDLSTDVWQTPPGRLFLAVVLTALNYVTLTGYDLLAFAYIGTRLPRAQIAGASFLAYAISNNVGFGVVSGASVRYRFYTRWGVTAEDLSRIVFSYSVTFWLGLFALGGLSLVAAPIPDITGVPARAVLVAIGWVLMAVPPAYVALTVLRREPFRFRQFVLPLPRPAIAVAQLAISCADWLLMGAVLYMLLPDHGPPFFAFLASFLVAILLGSASHVPGGLGVFEGLMVLMLRPYLSSAELLPPLVVFRAVYYLLPFAIALAGLSADEVRQRRTLIARTGALLGRAPRRVTPRVLAVLTFLAGVVLLFSGATPAAAGRLSILDRSCRSASSRCRTSSAAWPERCCSSCRTGWRGGSTPRTTATGVTLLAGMVASLLKGFDYEEASLLVVTLAVLLRARGGFDRRAAFFDTRFSTPWLAAVAGALAGSIWLGFFAFKHVNYSHDLWWQFELDGEASRFLRASVGAGLTLLLVAVARLMSVAPPEIATPSAADLADAERAIAAQSATSPFLSLLADKALLFDKTRGGFLMYGVQGRTWVAMGDPVCAPEQSARTGPRVSRALRRLRRHSGVLRNRQRAPAHLR